MGNIFGSFFKFCRILKYRYQRIYYFFFMRFLVLWKQSLPRRAATAKRPTLIRPDTRSWSPLECSISYFINSSAGITGTHKSFVRLVSRWDPPGCDEINASDRKKCLESAQKAVPLGHRRNPRLLLRTTSVGNVLPRHYPPAHQADYPAGIDDDC